MNYYLRTNNVDMTSYGGFQWPVEVGATVVAPDWDPIVECGKGLHGLKDGQGDILLLNWSGGSKWVIFSSEEDGVDLDGKVKVRKATVEYIGDVNGAIGFFAEREGLTVREWVCNKDPEWSYLYARNVDKEGHKDTRRAVCARPEYAYHYALFVDKKGHEDTRRAVCARPNYAYLYALYVDKKGRDVTRRAACASPDYAYLYAQFVDKKGRDVTRRAACTNPEYAYLYAQFVDKKARDDTREAVSQDPGLVSHYTRLFGK